ncbi:MAG: CHAT domain-containing protein [Nostocaceae cyanobacterium]|nr:CHAT domain-containing protein [Nostocaceae cyanobacterium]
MRIKYRTYWFFLLVIVGVLLFNSLAPALAKFPQKQFRNAREIISNSNSLIASSLEQGKTLYEAGNFAEAVRILQQAVKKYQQQGDTVKQAVTLSNLSLAYQQLGNWNDAQIAITDSLKLLEESNQNPNILAQTLNIQGKLQLGMGDAQSALQTWQKTAKIYQRVGDKNGVVRSRINQAQALRTQGFYRNSIKLLEELNQQLQSQPDSLEKVLVLRSLGDTLQLVGNLPESQESLEKGLEIAQRLQLTLETAAIYFSLGNNARAQNNEEGAIKFYQQAVKLSPNALTKVQVQLNYLSLLIENGKKTDTQTLIPVIKAQIDQLPPSHASIDAQINFAQNLIKLESGESNALASRILAFAVQQARNLGDTGAESNALGVLGSLYEKTQQWSEAQKLTQQALLLAQTSNAPEISYRWQWQLGRLQKAQGNIKGAIAAYDVAIADLESLRSDLVAVNQEVQFDFRDSVEPVYRESVALLLQSQQGQGDVKALDKARQRMEALQLAELDNFFREACLEGQTVVLDKVVDEDNPSAAILYPIILPQQLQVIVKIPKQPLRHYSTDISQKEVEKLVTQLRFNLVKPFAIKAVREQSQQVYNWLVQPIEKELVNSGVNTLVFVLDGVLRNLPMASLYDGKQYLVEKYAVALSVGLQLLDPKPLPKQQLNALTAGLSEPPKEFPQFAPLPAIKKEIELINESGVSTTSLVDQEFTSKALEKKVNTAPFNVLHLATHGQFSSRAQDTFILAADGAINVTEFDSILRSRDETRPDAVQLLVLSACQTAAGDKRAALGLAGAAVKAGARSTVASLWQIDDRSTAEFIGSFYRELKNPNISKAEALRQAQLQLLKHPNYNSPSFWSAYVLIGNWL